MRESTRTTRVAAALTAALLLAGCGNDGSQADGDADGETSAETSGDEEGDDAASTGGGTPQSAGGQLSAWPEEAAALLPLPDTMDLSTASPNEENPAYRGSGERSLEEIEADVDTLLEELGWEVTDKREDGSWLMWDAEHDDWTADISLNPKDDGGTFTEGGLSRKE